MRWTIFLVLFLLIVPISYAEVENYSNYGGMTLLYTANSEVDIDVVGNNPKLLDLTIKLNLMPREDDRQVVLDQEITTKPSTYANFDPSYDELLELVWKNLDENKVSYDITSRVLTKNKLSRIRKEDFPIRDSLSGELDKYIEATEYIDITVDIKKKANEIVKGENNLVYAVYNLAEWVRENIKYDLNTMTETVVQKSSWVLGTREGVCDEITNLFISFCRSVGVPARFVTGIAYSDIIGDFGNHGWAEVYFPNQGWVPFDITYGEYGWLDATHIKLCESKDSNVFSVNYNWKSRDIDVNTKDLETKTVLTNKGSKIEPPTQLEINLLKDNVGLDSYVPIQIIIENFEDYYVFDKIYLKKAPEVIDDNVKVVLLKPGEIREEYWLVHMPREMKSGYKYSALIGVESAFGSSSERPLYFSNNGEKFGLVEAEEKIDNLRKREKKTYFFNLGFNCNLLKQKYYSNENMNIKCDIKNAGNSLLENLNICLREDCKNFDLGISEKGNVEFKTYASSKVTIIAENDDMIKYVYLEPHIVEVPDIKISDLGPGEIGYGEKKEFKFVLETDYIAYDVDLKVENQKTHFDKITDKKIVSLELSGNKLINGLDVKVNYKDEEGKIYIKKEKLSVVVNNVPWYSRMFSWISSTI